MKDYYLDQKKVYKKVKTLVIDDLNKRGIKIDPVAIDNTLESEGYNVFPEYGASWLWDSKAIILIWHFYDKDGFKIDEHYEEWINLKDDLSGEYESQEDERMKREDFLRIHSAKLQKTTFSKHKRKLLKYTK